MISTLSTRYKNWRSAKNTMFALNKLDDRQLNDMGIARGDIHFLSLSSTKR